MPAPRRPDPPPLETDDVRIVAVGTTLWLVGLLGAVLFHGRLAAAGNADWVWIALSGLFLGLVGLRHVRRRRRSPRERDATGRSPVSHD